MMPIPRRREKAEEWLRYATEDLETAEILLGLASPKPKQALKTVLVFHDSPYAPGVCSAPLERLSWDRRV
jgi:hypothetical protein